MHGAILMLVTLTGLGCQNKPIDSTDLPAVLTATPESPAPEAPASATTATPPPYPRYSPETYFDPEALYSDHLSALHATLYSFVFGHDPGIPSAREIEASALGTGPGTGLVTASEAAPEIPPVPGSAPEAAPEIPPVPVPVTVPGSAPGTVPEQ